jgi:hypothetical protein
MHAQRQALFRYQFPVHVQRKIAKIVMAEKELVRIYGAEKVRVPYRSE